MHLARQRLQIITVINTEPGQVGGRQSGKDTKLEQLLICKLPRDESSGAVLDLKMKMNEDSDILGYQDDSALEIILMERTRENRNCFLCTNSQGMDSIGASETLISHSC